MVVFSQLLIAFMCRRYYHYFNYCPNCISLYDAKLVIHIMCIVLILMFRTLLIYFEINGKFTSYPHDINDLDYHIS